MFSDKSKSQYSKAKVVGIKYGYLIKQGIKVKTWKKRWFVMNHDYVRYHETPMEVQPLGTILLQDVICVAVPKESELSKPLSIKVATNARTYFMVAEEKKEFDEWLVALRCFMLVHPTRILNNTEKSLLPGQMISIFETISALIPTCNQILHQHVKDKSLERDLSNALSRVGSKCIYLAQSFSLIAGSGRKSGHASSGQEHAQLLQSYKQLQIEAEGLIALCVRVRSQTSQSLSQSLSECTQALEIASKIFDIKSSKDDLSLTKSTLTSTTADEKTLPKDAAQQSKPPLKSNPQTTESPNSSMNSITPARDDLSRTETQSTLPKMTRPSHLLGSQPEVFQQVDSSLLLTLLSELADSIGILISDLRSLAQPANIYTSAKLAATGLEKFLEASRKMDTAGLPDMLRMHVCDSIHGVHDSVIGILETSRTISQFEKVPANIQGTHTSAIKYVTNSIREFSFILHAVIEFENAAKLQCDIIEIIRKDLIILGEEPTYYIDFLRQISKSVETLSAMPGTMFKCLPEEQETAAQELLGQARDLVSTTAWISDESPNIGCRHSEFDLSTLREAIRDLAASVEQIINSLITTHSTHMSKLGVYHFFKGMVNASGLLVQILYHIKDSLQAAQIIPDTDTLEVDKNIWEDWKDTPENIILSDVEGKETIKAATLNKLVQRLTSNEKPDLNFRNVFITTYASFTTQEKLFKKLIERFDVPDRPSTAPESAEEYMKKVVLPIQLRVVNAMKTWLETCFLDIDETLYAKIVEFANTATLSDNVTNVSKFLGPTIQKAMKLRLTSMFTLKSSLDLNRETQVSGQHDAIRLILSEPIESIAAEITTLDFAIFQSIRSAELLNQKWSKPKLKHKAPHVLRMISRFNAVSQFVATTLLMASKLKLRTRVYTRFIEIASALKRMNNFNGLMAIIAAFGFSSIHRLKHTKAGISRTHQQELESLEALTSSHKSYQTLRERIHNINPPCVPYL
eukprot:TRINITY_DN3704_c0_g1_i3.p1 TRINITY_DN3704_c0_g1~~TRINITY_DN3704_c0_g1_i3.p1  ORF type:complete len:974 (+),score=196.84 TRINITY_DN3704_c0_g1_i3:59-2980(+)